MKVSVRMGKGLHAFTWSILEMYVSLVIINV